jgi:signal transduction histidine kinase/CheY-like chemotaxis protein
MNLLQLRRSESSPASTAKAMAKAMAKPNHEDDAELGSTVEEEEEKHPFPPEVRQVDATDDLTSTNNMYVFVSSLKPLTSHTWIIVTFIFLLGAAACGVIICLNVPAAKEQQSLQFERLAGDLLQKFETAVQNYMVAGLWLHQACRQRDKSQKEFRDVYDYLLSTGLEFQAVSFAMNVTNNERSVLENTTRAYLHENYPDVNYRGFSGFEQDPETGQARPGPRSNSSFYFPVHYVEPIEDIKNQAALDFDIYTSPLRRHGIEEALRSGKPALTERLKLIQESQIGTESYAYSVIMFHPGTSLRSHPDEGPRDVSVLAIRIPELLTRSYQNFSIADEGVSVFLFDSTDTSQDPPFLGGAHIHADKDLAFLITEEVEHMDVHDMKSNYLVEKDVWLASRRWTFLVVAQDGAFEPDVTFILLGAIMICVACTSLALWIFTSSRREAKMNRIRSAAEAEKSEFIVENAKKTALHERELNDFIAHEVRNPLSAALSACSFVSSSVNEAEPLIDQETVKSVREDVKIMDSSLHFINDLLRDMLDMHRASSNQLKIELTHVDLLRDVLHPAASMIYRRGDNFEVLLACPEQMVVMSDGLRLKQIALNLCRNAAKFVTKGFVRLRVDVVDGSVVIYVEDSGPGIPLEKRDKLFAKFQESLDSVNQGTGIGLCLCKNLIDLLGGHIWLDEGFDSGVEGCPGTRLVIDLKTPPVEWNPVDFDKGSDGVETSAKDLPSTLSLLFVDDTFVLRKLFGRSVKRIAPDWKVEEAASGETALRLVEEGNKYDLIFVDQYMASTDKQLLGTEAIRAMRAKGVKSIICGLSANDLEKAFLNAGADAFTIKPFPCEENLLRHELVRILKTGKNSHTIS